MPTVLPSTAMLPLPLHEAVVKLAELGFSEIEANFYNLDVAEVEYPAVLNAYRVGLLAAAEAGVSVRVVHAPWEGFFLAFLGAGVNKVVEEARLLLDIFSSYGVEMVVFHPIRSQLVGSGRVEWINRRLFSLLADYVESEGLGVTIALENLSRGLPWQNPREVDRLVASLGYDNVGVCIDTGHLNLNGFSASAVDKHSSRILCVHVNDNNGSVDEHCAPGCGTFNWAEVGNSRISVEPRYWVAEVHCRTGERARCASQVKPAYYAVSGLTR